jgi:dihydrofolate reductase
MGKIKVYIAASLDGYIARPDGDLDWLTEFPNPSKEDYGYNEMLTSVDTVIMGGRTYHELSCMDILYIKYIKHELSADNLSNYGLIFFYSGVSDGSRDC